MPGVDAGVQLHRGRHHGVRARLQARDRALALGAHVRPERHARGLHTVRPDEGQPGLVDADDHQVQRCVRPT